jgi:hypothetical protein
MDLALLAAVVAKNSADLVAIEAEVGFPVLLKLWPHILAIMTTAQQQEKAP